MPLSYYQLHVQTDYISDIITQLMQFPLQHYWPFLNNINERHKSTSSSEIQVKNR